jgi:hypothetical protein
MSVTDSRRRGGPPTWPLVALAAALALGGIGYVAHPHALPHVQPMLDRLTGAADGPDPAPPRPVRASLGGLDLTVPRDLVRFEPQRRDGEQARLDLVFHWPSLAAVTPGRNADVDTLGSLVFLAITPADEALEPRRRLAAIYQRFLGPDIRPEPAGLASRSFRPGSGYDGEDLVYEPSRPGDFFLRCAPPTATAPAGCLRELRLGGRIDVVYRFPRPLLPDWQRVDRAVMALLAAVGVPE